MILGKRIVALFLAVLGGILMPLLLWIGVIAAFRQIFTEWQATRRQLSSGNVLCSTTNDCPPSYQCVSGKCLPAWSL